jgi:hypothetical protein
MRHLAGAWHSFDQAGEADDRSFVADDAGELRILENVED